MSDVISSPIQVSSLHQRGDYVVGAPTYDRRAYNDGGTKILPTGAVVGGNELSQKMAESMARKPGASLLQPQVAPEIKRKPGRQKGSLSKKTIERLKAEGKWPPVSQPPLMAAPGSQGQGMLSSAPNSTVNAPLNVPSVFIPPEEIIEEKVVVFQTPYGNIRVTVECVLEEDTGICLIFSDLDSVSFTPKLGDPITMVVENGDPFSVFYTGFLFTLPKTTKQLMILAKIPNEPDGPTDSSAAE